MKCVNEKCSSEAISVTLDGGYGERAHCLQCGHIWKPEAVKPEVIKKQVKAEVK